MRFLCGADQLSRPFFADVKSGAGEGPVPLNRLMGNYLIKVNSLPITGRGRALILGDIDDADNGQGHTAQAQKAADDPDNKAQDRDPAQNGGNHADDHFQQEQDKTLVGMEPDVRVILFHKQAQKAQHGEITKSR